MMWPYSSAILFVIIGMELSRGHHIESDIEENGIIDNLSIEPQYGARNGKKVPSYSEWSCWSGCIGGHKIRRRHCLHRHICGDALRVEVASCGKFRDVHRGNCTPECDLGQPKNVYKYIILSNPDLRQLDADDVQKKFRGFSPWSSWNSCSRKCTTVRKRHCLKTSLCGRKVIRQSAYCYLEGSYCQLWIRSRMQRRKDPGEIAHRFTPYPAHGRIGRDNFFADFQALLVDWRNSTPRSNLYICSDYTISETMPQPVPAIHPEDSRALSNMGVCGRLGRYRSMNARLRAKMRDMVRIIGGRPAPPGKWVWQVAVLNRYKEAFCGGTLIALRWVVTAAHCVRRKLYVRLGEHDLLIRGYGEVEMRVTEAVIHPQYDPDTVVNDVALLRLPARARPDLGHGIVCLPTPQQILPPHSNCMILGWGKRRPSDVHGTRILHEAQVSTIQQGVCRRSYWQYAITDNMVCAGRGHKDSCAGDSGGPLLCKDRTGRYILQGITSFGDGCGKRGKYGIYTRTAGYVNWMRNIMDNKYFDD